MSLPALFRLILPRDWRLDIAETEVALVVAEREAESRELLVVGVLAYVVEDAELRLGVKLWRVVELPCFFDDLSGEGELYCGSLTAASSFSGVASMMPKPTLGAC